MARLGIMRLGYYQPWIKVFINGVDRSGTTFISGMSITDELNHAPNNATFRCRGFTPVKGHEVKIYMGDTTSVFHQLFGGRILSLEQGFEGLPTNVVWDCTCIDYTWLLNRRTVIDKYTSQSATAIVLDLMASYTSGVTITNVVAGLPTIDEITFTNEDVTDALSRIADRIGGYWFVDYANDLHFFLTETDTAGEITDASPRTASDVRQSVDLSQVATRVVARGGGSNTAADVAVGQTTIPVEDLSWYVSGEVESGPQRITYTGIAAASETGSTTGFTLSPPATFTVLPDGNAGSLDISAQYGYAITYTTPEGETTPSTTVFGSSSASGATKVENIVVPVDPRITLKNIYRTDGGGVTLKKRGTIGPAITVLSPDLASDATLTTAAPTINTAGVSAIATAAGSTTLEVEDLSVFAASGWADVGGMVFSYTGRSATSGSGTLTGIPVSGIGSLTAAVRSGTVRSIPHLTGVSGVLYAIPKGEAVNIVVTVNDTTAQTAMAGFVGGDGIHEMFISDGRWGITEATARATAELTMRKNPLVTVSLTSRDPTIVSGRNLTITLTNPAISGTFKVQRVTLSHIGLGGLTGKIFPIRQVDLSSRHYSFEDLLRQIKKGLAA